MPLFVAVRLTETNGYSGFGLVEVCRIGAGKRTPYSSKWPAHGQQRYPIPEAVAALKAIQVYHRIIVRNPILALAVL